MNAGPKWLLVSDIAIVTRPRHAVMDAQSVVAPRQIGPYISVEIAERRRQPVVAMLGWTAAQSPQGILQPLGQRDVAFAAQDHMRLLEARPNEPEVHRFRDGVPLRRRSHGPHPTHRSHFMSFGTDSQRICNRSYFSQK